MKLSIITVNLNNANGLRKTIESIGNQTFTDFEYIIIDGESTDGSVEVIEKFADRITYWVSEQDKGIYNAMNKGILRASGEYLQFLNSGDWLVNNNVYQDIFDQDSECDIIYGNLIKVYPSGRMIIDKGIGGQNISLLSMFLGTLNHEASFIKKELFNLYGFYDEKYRIVSDWKFFLKSVGMNKARVRYIDINVAYFDMLGESNTQLGIRQMERKEVLKELIPIPILSDYENFGMDIFLIDVIKKHRLTSNLFRLALKILIRLSRILDKF